MGHAPRISSFIRNKDAAASRAAVLVAALLVFLAGAADALDAGHLRAALLVMLTASAALAMPAHQVLVALPLLCAGSTDLREAGLARTTLLVALAWSAAALCADEAILAVSVVCAGAADSVDAHMGLIALSVAPAWAAASIYAAQLARTLVVAPAALAEAGRAAKEPIDALGRFGAGLTDLVPAAEGAVPAGHWLVAGLVAQTAPAGTAGAAVLVDAAGTALNQEAGREAPGQARISEAVEHVPADLGLAASIVADVSFRAVLIFLAWIQGTQIGRWPLAQVLVRAEIILLWWGPEIILLR